MVLQENSHAGQDRTFSPELEADIRQKLAANPFIKFVGITAPQLGKGYARFLLPFKPELANTIGLMQGGVIAALADEAVAYALYSLVADGRRSTRWR